MMAAIAEDVARKVQLKTRAHNKVARTVTAPEKLENFMVDSFI